MAKTTKNYKKRTLKQWIYRYMIILFVIGILCGGVIVASNAAYNKSVTATDSVRVAKWEFTLNDENILHLSSEPLNLLANSFYSNTSMIIKDGSTTHNATLVPGMKGTMTYQLKNKSEVNATINEMVIKLQFNINSPTPEMDSWDDSDWQKLIRSMPIEWFITIVDKTDNGLNDRTIKILVDSYLTNYQVSDSDDGKSKILYTTWDIIADDSDALDFNFNTEYKVIQLNWEWSYDRTESKQFYNESNTTDSFEKIYTALEYTAYASANSINLNVEPSFNYEDENGVVKTKSYSQFSFDDYLDLYSYCQNNNDFRMIYKFFNYHEYLKWKNYYFVPDDYMPSITDNKVRQQLYLDDIDTKFSNYDFQIDVLLDLTIIQKEPKL